MKKLVIHLLFVSLAFSANSPFNRVRTISYDSDGTPNQEVLDLSICLERVPSESEKLKYESVIGYYADGLYEVTNGAHYLGNVTFYVGGRFCSSSTIKWDKTDAWPASGGSFTGGGFINVSDDWGTGNDHLLNEQNRFDFGMTLTHETMHYIYAVDDDYAKTFLTPLYFAVSVSADPGTDRITLRNNGLYYGNYEFKRRVSPFSHGSPVVFLTNDAKSAIPLGLSSGAIRGTGYMVNDYALVDQVWDDSDAGIYTFNLKDSDGNRIDILDEGFGIWGVDLPSFGFASYNKSSVAHSIMNYQYDVASSYGCNPDAIQWQWANLSTGFNINPYSAQGMCCYVDGKPSSAWDVVARNPAYDVVFGYRPPANWRYWFKSLAKRKPKASDMFVTKSFMMNYNSATGKVENGYAVWLRNDVCGAEKLYNLPYMKVELAGKTQAEYREDTHKYLNIEWVDRPKVETIVLMDVSVSMSVEQKLENAKLAAKYAYQAFLSADVKYDVSNIFVGVYTFNDNIYTIFDLSNNIPIAEVDYVAVSPINDVIDAQVASGNTKLYDALYFGINRFSNDPSSLKLLYVITDGIDFRSETTKQAVVEMAKSKDVSIHAFAYGKKAQRELLSSLATETGGMYFEEENGMNLKIQNYMGAVLAASPEGAQLKSANLMPNQTSENIHVPQRLKRIRVYASYDGMVSSSPLSVLTQNGSVVPFHSTSNVIGNTVYYTAEIDSVSLASLPSPVFKVKNMVANANLDFRVIAMGEYQDYSMNAILAPDGLFEWPEQKHVTTSIRGPKGLLAGVSALGKLIKPDGNVETFALYDDGTNGDFRAGDGLYFANLPSISTNGTYQWEVSMSNLNGSAHTTLVGSTLPDSIPFLEEFDSTPFELVRNGQFIVTGCCSDEPVNSNQLIKLLPEKQVHAYLQSGLDVDKFKIESTVVGKSYYLRLSSMNLDAFDRIEVYANSGAEAPVYTVNVERSGSDFVSVPLSAEFAKPGNIVSVIATNSNSGTNYELILLETESAEFAVGRFEVITDWNSLESSLVLDAGRKSEGLTSLVSPAGWKTIESRNVSTMDIDVVGEKMAIDVFVPVNTVNPYWMGSMELWIYVPSLNKRVQLGSLVMLEPYFGAWKSYEFDVPMEVRNVFGELHEDVRFQIVLNTADSLWIDNLRFVGQMRDNPVGKKEPECPQDIGCDPSRPITLRVNESVRIESEGNVWIEIVDFPVGWTPAMVCIGVSAEDGAELTGFVSYDNGTYPLMGWYVERSFDFIREKRYLVQLYDVGRRAFRVNAWTMGQLMNVASMKTPYNVVF